MITDRLRSLREGQGLTRGDLSEMINVPLDDYCLWEDGKENMPLLTLIKISDFYGVSVDYLLGISDMLNYDDGKEEYDKLDLAYNLRKLRKQIKFTHDRLARKFKVDKETIIRYETANEAPTLDFVLFYADKCGMSVDYMLGRTKELPEEMSQS